LNHRPTGRQPGGHKDTEKTTVSTIQFTGMTFNAKHSLKNKLSVNIENSIIMYNL
jgi:hypothetical protein